MDPYDAVPYPGGAFPRSHPAHLAAVARLFGVPASDPARCRVLEIGCGEGRNLLPMAAVLPDATFVGIDPARTAIDAALARRAEAGLANVAFHAVGVEAIDASWGSFDYVVCHGVWSWVAPEVRAEILAVCGRHLAPGGVAYVSYNTLPGWYLEMPARDLMRRHAAGFLDPLERTGQARAVLELLRDGARSQMPAYAQAARELSAVLEARSDGYLFHEHLAEHHEPVYFTDFAAAAGSAGLRYLAEADVSQLFDHDLPPAGREGVALLGQELIAREQLLDFLRGRLFRATLLVREGTTIHRQWTPDRLAGLWLRTGLRALADGRYHLDRRHIGFEGEPPAVLRRLVDAAPAALPASEIVSDPRDGVIVLDLLSRGLVEARAVAPPWTTAPSDRPVATALARAEARAGDTVVALDHTTVRLKAAQRAMVASADGATRQPRRALSALARACLWRGPAT